MSELISGKEALIALANGEDVQWFTGDGFRDIGGDWQINEFSHPSFKFRLKPHTIMIGNIEVPAPFEPKGDCIVFILDDSKTGSYRAYNYEHDGDNINSFISMWESEDEIKQVVGALRSIFNAN